MSVLPLGSGQPGLGWAPGHTHHSPAGSQWSPWHTAARPGQEPPRMQPDLCREVSAIYHLTLSLWQRVFPEILEGSSSFDGTKV